jgi:hypothetical protein
MEAAAMVVPLDDMAMEDHFIGSLIVVSSVQEVPLSVEIQMLSL